MQELDSYSKIAMNVLEEAEDEHDRVMLVRATSLHTMTVNFCDTSDTSQSILRDFMSQQMTPSAAAFLQQAYDDPTGQISASGFSPRSLVNVFKHTSPPLYLQMLKESLYFATVFYFGQNKVRLGMPYYRLSQLPLVDTWASWMECLPTPTSVLSAIGVKNPTADMDLASWPDISARDHSKGQVNSKLDLLRYMIAGATEVDLNRLAAC